MRQPRSGSPASPPFPKLNTAGSNGKPTNSPDSACTARAAGSSVSNRDPSAKCAGYSDWLAADEAALDYVATRIAPKFGVSVEVIAKRSRLEKLWPPQ